MNLEGAPATPESPHSPAGAPSSTFVVGDPVSRRRITKVEHREVEECLIGTIRPWGSRVPVKVHVQLIHEGNVLSFGITTAEAREMAWWLIAMADVADDENGRGDG